MDSTRCSVTLGDEDVEMIPCDEPAGHSGPHIGAYTDRNGYVVELSSTSNCSRCHQEIVEGAPSIADEDNEPVHADCRTEAVARALYVMFDPRSADRYWGMTQSDAPRIRKHAARVIELALRWRAA